MTHNPEANCKTILDNVNSERIIKIAFLLTRLCGNAIPVSNFLINPLKNRILRGKKIPEGINAHVTFRKIIESNKNAFFFIFLQIL